MSLPTPYTICQQTHDFIRSQILPVLDWADFESAVSYWVNRQDNDPSGKACFTDVFPSLIHVALGGDRQETVPLAAFWLLNILAARIFDDIQDHQGKDNPWYSGGVSQALPTGITLLTAANICLGQLQTDIDSLQAVLDAFGRAGALAAKAQSLSPTTDLSSSSLEQYFFHIIGSTAEIFAAGAWAGGRLVHADETTLKALRQFGHNIGMRIAILSDCFDLHPSSPHNPSDLSTGSYRLPVLYAVSLTKHPDHLALMELLTKGKLDGERLGNTISLLENMGAISWTAQMADEFRQQAFAALEPLPQRTKEVLANYV